KIVRGTGEKSISRISNAAELYIQGKLNVSNNKFINATNGLTTISAGLVVESEGKIKVKDGSFKIMDNAVDGGSEVDIGNYPYQIYSKNSDGFIVQERGKFDVDNTFAKVSFDTEDGHGIIYKDWTAERVSNVDIAMPKLFVADQIKDKKLMAYRYTNEGGRKDVIIATNSNHVRYFKNAPVYKGVTYEVTGEMEDSVIEGGEAILTSNSYKADGFTFVGWTKAPASASFATKASDVEVDYKDNDTIKGIDENEAELKLYARWKVVRYEVEYEPGNKSVKGTTKGSGKVLGIDEIIVASESFIYSDAYKFIKWGISRVVVDGVEKSTSSSIKYLKQGEKAKYITDIDNSKVYYKGLWNKEEATVIIDEENNDDDQEFTEDEIINYDDNNILYSIIGTISEIENTDDGYEVVEERGEDLLSDEELLIKVPRNSTLSEVLGDLLIENAEYINIPIYDKKYTIVIDDNKPSGANDSDKVVKSKTKDTIYENDRIKLFDGINISLKGYKFKGFSSKSDGEVEYKVSEIVRKYKNINDAKNTNVKALKADETTREIKLYCVWEAITYNVVFDRGNTQANIRVNKVVSNPKTYGVWYDDLAFNDNYTYYGHNFRYWQVMKVVDKDNVEVYGYRYERATLTSASRYRNLIDIDGATVTLKAIWSDTVYTINFDIATPSGATVKYYGMNIPNKTLLLDQEREAPKVTSVLDGYVFKGWDTIRTVATPTYIPKKSKIYGLGYTYGETVTLYGIWGEANAKVYVDEEDGGDGEEHSADEELEDPIEPHDTDDEGNEFSHYIIASRSDMYGEVIEEEGLTDEELLAKFGGETGLTLSEALMENLDQGSTYKAIPIYKNTHTIVINDNLPKTADSQVVKNKDRETVYLDDRNELFKDLDIKLKGHKFKGFSDSANGSLKYEKGDIVRIYGREDNNSSDNVKSLIPNSSKVVNLYCIWEPITYYVVFSKGVSNVQERTAGGKNNGFNSKKTYGVEYKDLSWSSSWGWSGHSAAYWQVDSVAKKNGEELYGYEFDKTRYNFNASYKNLTDIDEATVTLKAIWTNNHYTINYVKNRPEDGEVIVDAEMPSSVRIDSQTVLIATGSNTVIKDYIFRGWDRNSLVSTPSYPVGSEMYGLLNEFDSDNDEISLYEIWAHPVSKVLLPTKEDEYEEYDVTEDLPAPFNRQDEEGNNFLYY
ncbi:MAG: hypothetical protein IKP66_02625, partial [Lachnospiraceae bacterium]|nr:hypothetical protein [Lachnospiraceae bacterium]